MDGEVSYALCDKERERYLFVVFFFLVISLG